MTRYRTAPVRVRQSHVEWLLHSLSERDWRVIETVGKLRLVTGVQLERLLFTELSHRSRPVVRWRVLKRLVESRVLTTARRRIGGGLRGSARQIYALDSAGQWLLQVRVNRDVAVKLRRPAQPGERFVEHTVAVAELYTSLVEQQRRSSFTLVAFDGEPAAWWPNGFGGWLKPDAFLILADSAVVDYWWCEVDMATESMTTIRSKLQAYLDFLRRGQLGPGDVVPRVLVAVPTEARAAAIQTEVARLAEPADRLFAVSTQPQAACFLLKELGT